MKLSVILASLTGAFFAYGAQGAILLPGQNVTLMPTDPQTEPVESSLPIVLEVSLQTSIAPVPLDSPFLTGAVLNESTVAMIQEVGAPGLDGTVGWLQQRVIRNSSGTLDFYYRFMLRGEGSLGVSNAYLQGFLSGVALDPFYASDGPGDIFAGQAEIINNGELFFWQFDAGAVLTTTGTRFLILRSDATHYAPSGQFEALLNTAPSIAYGVAVPVRAVPEPSGLGILGLAVAGSLLGRGRGGRGNRPAPIHRN